jgi:Cu/Zn superoxide dismutase
LAPAGQRKYAAAVAVASRLGLLWLVLAVPACSGRVEAPDNAGPSVAGRQSSPPLAPRPVVVGGTSSGGGAAEDPGDLPVGGADAQLAAEATLMPTSGNSVTGSAHFTQLGQHLELTVTLSGCPAGPHALHLHVNPSCGDSANAAGGHWSPQGDGLGEVTCAADGSAEYSHTPADGRWSLGGPASTDLLRRALVLHAGPALPEPGARIACGIPVKVE